MKLLVTGGQGQLGRALARRGAMGLGARELDITSEASITAQLAAHAPDVVINAAAYTAVDKAESEPERAHAVNAVGAGHVARACAERGIRCLHVSTDYVFDGMATAPYREEAVTEPTGVYGRSKAEGERRVWDAGGVVVRTSWLFEQDGPSFVHTMLRLARERPVLRVVADQVGCPTWADDLAAALLVLAAQPTLGATYHYCDDGVTSWHGFASAIVEEGRRHRALACERVEAITTAEYPTPARRPAYSVLDTSRVREMGIATPHWRTGLADVVAHVLRS